MLERGSLSAVGFRRMVERGHSPTVPFDLGLIADCLPRALGGAFWNPPDRAARISSMRPA